MSIIGDYKFDTSKYIIFEGHNDHHRDNQMRRFREAMTSFTNYTPGEFHEGDTYQSISDDIIAYVRRLEFRLVAETSSKSNR